MNKIQRYQKTIKQLCFAYSSQTNPSCIRNYCTEGKTSESKINTDEQQLTLKLSENEGNSETLELATFTSLLRKSPFMDLGDPEGKMVYGTIFHVVDNDLYIDFGWKFHCVCSKPQTNNINYIKGAKVKLRIKSLELSSRFLGATSDLSILEADCILVGLVSSSI